MTHIAQVQGTVVEGKKIARSEGFPTANITLDSQESVDLTEGVYLGMTRIEGDQANHPSLIFFGKPFFLPEVTAPRFETYLLDAQIDLYGKRVSVDLIAFVRENKKFATKELLQRAIQEDFQTAQTYFSTCSPASSKE